MSLKCFYSKQCQMSIRLDGTLTPPPPPPSLSSGLLLRVTSMKISVANATAESISTVRIHLTTARWTKWNNCGRLYARHHDLDLLTVRVARTCTAVSYANGVLAYRCWAMLFRRLASVSQEREAEAVNYIIWIMDVFSYRTATSNV